MEFKISFSGCVGMICSVLMLIGVFLTWINTGDITGFKIITDFNGYEYQYFPLIVMIAAIVGIILALLVFMEKIGTGIVWVPYVIIGLVADILSTWVVIDLDFGMGIGYFVVMLTGAILFVPLTAKILKYVA